MRSSVLNAISLSLIPLMVKYPLAINQIAFCAIFFLWGIARGYSTVPYFIVAENFDSKMKDKKLINFWAMGINLGGVIPFIVVPPLLNYYNWKGVFGASLLLLPLASILLYKVAD